MLSSERAPAEWLEFGPFQLRPDDRLFRNGVPLSLAPKESAVLRTLAEADGRVVSKEELIRRVWLGTPISDTSVTTCIYLLRKHLAESRGAREIVESVYGRGYRITVPVRRVAADRSLLVLPTLAGTARPGSEALAGEFTTALLCAFGRSRTPGMSLLGPESAGRPGQPTDPWDDAVRDSGARLALRSTLALHTAREFRLDVELRRVDDGALLLSQRFAGHPQSLPPVAEAIVQATAHHLPVRDMPPAHGRLRRAAQAEPKVYEAYLEARHWFRRGTAESIRKAVGFFERAIQWDSAYAPACIGLADCWIALCSLGAAAPADALSQVATHLKKAEALDPAVPGAGILRAAIASLMEWEFDEAEALFRAELDRDPADVVTLNYYVRHLVAAGRPDDAVASAEHLVELDPLSPVAHGLAAYALHFQRQPQKSLAAARHAVDLDPGNCQCLAHLASAASRLGDHSTALAAARKAYELSDGLGTIGAICAVVCAESGQTGEARRLVTAARSSSPRAQASVIALAYAALGDERELSGWLASALRERCIWLPSLRHDPRLGHYATRPWFARAFERVRTPANPTYRHLAGGATSGAFLQA